MTPLHLRHRLKRVYKLKIRPYWKIVVAQLACVIYILVFTFSPAPIGVKDPATGDIIDVHSETNTSDGVIYMNGDSRPIVAVGAGQKFCLAVSRMSAFAMVIAFLTKMKGIQTFLAKSQLSIHIKMLTYAHDYHDYAGRFIAFDIWVHTLFHLIRWGLQGNVELLWTSRDGLSGLIAVVATALITFPMMYFKNKLSFETRKALHSLFYVFAIALCFHVPPTAIPNGGYIAYVLGGCIVLYTLDATYVFFFMTERVETTSFDRIAPGMRISMPVSERFVKAAETTRFGYAYINIPWVNKNQWHAFSLFENPLDPSIQQMFIMKNGNWTKSLHNILSRASTRPCYIKGPFPSPYSHANLYDNQILIASGVGITPALAAIGALAPSRRMNLIWMVRDRDLLEFVFTHFDFDDDAWTLIFYTGKEPVSARVREKECSYIRIIEGRPRLSSVILNIMYGIESKKGLPETFHLISNAEGLPKSFGLEHEPSFGLEHESGYDDSKDVEWVNFVPEPAFDAIKSGNKQAAVDPSTASSSREGDQSSEDNTKSTIKGIDVYRLGSDVYGGHHISKTQLSSFRRLSSNGSGDHYMPYHRRNSVDVRRRTITPSHSPRKQHRLSLKAFGAGLSLCELTVTQEMPDADVEKQTEFFKPWEKNEEQEEYVKGLERSILKDWCMMYCGGSGSASVVDILEDLSVEYNIPLHVEKFAW